MKIMIVWQARGKITYKHFSNLLDYEDADKIGYGKTVLIGFSLPLKNRILKAVKAFLAGIHYGYPLCCILNFCIDSLLDRPAAQLRWSDKTEFVECCFHVRKHGKQIIPLDLY
jgi:hypothetical protein